MTATVLDAAYFRSLRPAPEPEAQEYPAPEHTSRDPWPADFPIPGPVLQLRKQAEVHGWAVRVAYSRGWLPNRTTRKPGTRSHVVTVQCLHPESRARLLATYVIPVESPSGKKWDSVIITSPKIPPYAGCSITDAKQYLQAAGRVLPSWLEQIRERNADKQAKAKAAPKRSGKRTEAGG